MNHRPITHLFTLLTAVMVSSSVCWAKSPKPAQTIRPAWSKVSNAQKGTNASYLTRTQAIENETLNDEVFLDDDASLAIRTEAERRIDANEMRRNQGLVNYVEVKSQNDEMKGLTRRAMSEVGQQQAKSGLRKIRHFAKSSLEAVREPIAVAVMAAALYNGKAMRFKVAEVPFEGRTAIKNKDASLSMILPGLTSTVAYTDEDKISGRVSKSIDDNISAVVDTASKGTFQVIYGVQF